MSGGMVEFPGFAYEQVYQFAEAFDAAGFVEVLCASFCAVADADVFSHLSSIPRSLRIRPWT